MGSVKDAMFEEMDKEDRRRRKLEEETGRDLEAEEAFEHAMEKDD